MLTEEQYFELARGLDSLEYAFNNPYKNFCEKEVELDNSIYRLLEITDDSDIREKLEELKIGLIKLISGREYTNEENIKVIELREYYTNKEATHKLISSVWEYLRRFKC